MNIIFFSLIFFPYYTVHRSIPKNRNIKFFYDSTTKRKRVLRRTSSNLLHFPPPLAFVSTIAIKRHCPDSLSAPSSFLSKRPTKSTKTTYDTNIWIESSHLNYCPSFVLTSNAILHVFPWHQTSTVVSLHLTYKAQALTKWLIQSDGNYAQDYLLLFSSWRFLSQL